MTPRSHDDDQCHECPISADYVTKNDLQRSEDRVKEFITLTLKTLPCEEHRREIAEMRPITSNIETWKNRVLGGAAVIGGVWALVLAWVESRHH